MYEYNCIINRIIDGDTVVVDIDLGFGIWIKSESIRLHGVDAPEIRTKDAEEKVFGKYAKDYVEKLLQPGMPYTFISKQFSTGKYGRILGDFYIGDELLTSILLKNHVVAVYREGELKYITEQEHLDNRDILVKEGKVWI
jgi:micrococcal nuclease